MHKLVLYKYIITYGKIYKLMLLYYQRKIRKNIYPQPNLIRPVFGLYSLPIDFDVVFISTNYPVRFGIRKNMVMNVVSLLSICIRSGFTPSPVFLRMINFRLSVWSASLYETYKFRCIKKSVSCTTTTTKIMTISVL
jgi:hypothetical protein